MKKHVFFIAYLIFLAASGVFAVQSWAAPAINSADGTFNHNQTVTILGSGFGAKAKASPVLWDTVDNIPSYSGLSNGATIPMGGSNPWPSPYGNSSGNNTVKYNTSDAKRGIGTAQYKATNQTAAYLDGLTWPATNYVYISWWWKQDRDVSGANHSSKYLRISSSSDEVNKTFSWTQQQNYVYSNPNYCSNNWNGWGGNPNNWNFLEAWFNSANRTYTLRVNGSAIANNISWSSCSPFQLNELWKIGFDGGGVSPPSITWWMDDIYVDSSFSRVMIGNASTYAASTHFEMQIPTAWSDTSVTTTVNLGSFAANQQAYLYILDANGSVNTNGYPITVGGSGTGTSAPQAPKGLQVAPQ